MLRFANGRTGDCRARWYSRSAHRLAAMFLLASGVLATSAALADAPRLPVTDQDCPDIHEGKVAFLGVDAHVVVAGTGTKPGPAILYWHGTGTDPLEELERSFDDAARRELREAGGLLVAFTDSTGSGATTSGNGIWHEGDLLLADQVIACAAKQQRIDPTRIHAMGMSAGGLHVALMSYRRAHYLASVATLSGGHLVFRGHDSTVATSSAPDNRLAALIVHGGDSDQHILDFGKTSAAYAATLRSRGHEAIVCQHDQGHAIPATASAAAWRFFQDHAFGSGKIYASGRVPAEIRTLCVASVSTTDP